MIIPFQLLRVLLAFSTILGTGLLSRLDPRGGSLLGYHLLPSDNILDSR
jgi:hypothetical protein